ncbi:MULTISPECIES: 2-oxo-4-hydroxy-4-carboxy-5-ureidoimidazoline decarboxylase [Streptomyces]|uniref:2-oxo-4-hydroxy-4-carboxy-5-ureidoimidazoline decarboxylase n=1 Tax=Streptomyces lichenis TaxID=2306967 RepID=A0ABT0I716_9ACTN|nr:2-oxo-4-hydroxy-4-carboxy-5-ureidoimidazoline decarboxylase [Streptomyces lichenis]MCK8677122.1 2-oxo-4-hydroxy-4-carboxy-5-ureidoimidazoline decarboxylase [Streptomyces lichenis]
MAGDPTAGVPGAGAAPAAARALPAQARGSLAGSPLTRFNEEPAGAAEAALLACCGSRRWAARMAAHRPYPTLDALLAAADEAGYDLGGADLDEALADETAPLLPPGAPPAALTAWDAALIRYEERFGHAFTLCLEGRPPREHLDLALAAIHTRLDHEADHERSVAADELRRLARARLARLIGTWTEPPR